MALIPKNRYPGQTSTLDSAYPHGKARNVATPGDGSGTPWEADLINDHFGFQQALLYRAGLTPNGVPDAVNASQYVQAIVELIAQLKPAANDWTGYQRILTDFDYITPLQLTRVIPLAAGVPGSNAITFLGDCWQWATGTVGAKLYFPVDLPFTSKVTDVRLMVQAPYTTHLLTAALEWYQPNPTGPFISGPVSQRVLTDSPLVNGIVTKSIPQNGSTSQQLLRNGRNHQVRVQIDNANSGALGTSQLRAVIVDYELAGQRFA